MSEEVLLRKRTAEVIDETVEKARESINQDFEPFDRDAPLDFSKVVSTQSTLLDLAISGSVIRGGGIPGGLLVECFGASGSGKSAILTSVCASAQHRGGEAIIKDPEGRVGMEYAQVYGAQLNQDNYSRPDTVIQTFEEVRSWKPKDMDALNVVGVDSLAALSTEMEMEEEDKRGQLRAKHFSQEMRKTCRVITNNNWLVFCTNQLRQGDNGDYAPGGEAVKFYSSLRLKVKYAFPSYKLERSIKLKTGDQGEEEQEHQEKRKRGTKEKEVEVKQIIGIHSEVEVVKSIVDAPYRKADIYIVFGIGIHDVMANLQWLKEMTKATSYTVDGSKSFVGMDQAIAYVVENGLEEVLRNRVIDLWEEIDKQFKAKVKVPRRFF